MSKRLIFRLFCLLVLVGTMTFNSATTARAERLITRQNITAPLNYQLYAPCINHGAGEYLLLTGTAHLVLQQSVDPLDFNSFQTVLNINYQNASAVSSLTGMRYRITQNTHEQYKTIGKPTVLHLRDTMVVVGPGPENIYRIHYDLTLVVNANGVYVIDRNDYTINCGYVF